MYTATEARDSGLIVQSRRIGEYRGLDPQERLINLYYMQAGTLFNKGVKRQCMNRGLVGYTLIAELPNASSSMFSAFLWCLSVCLRWINVYCIAFYWIVLYLWLYCLTLSHACPMPSVESALSHAPPIPNVESALSHAPPIPNVESALSHAPSISIPTSAITFRLHQGSLMAFTINSHHHTHAWAAMAEKSPQVETEWICYFYDNHDPGTLLQKIQSERCCPIN